MSFVKGYSENSSFESLHGKEKSAKLSKEDALKRMNLEKPKVELYKKLCNKVLEGNKLKIYNQEYYNLVTDLLKWNKELYTVWNYRKELIINYLFEGLAEDDIEKKHEILTEELYFVTQQLHRSPKSYWIWNHRMWCLQMDHLSDWDGELKLIDKFLQVDSRNYHVWSYRRFIIGCQKRDTNVDLSDELIDYNEFKFTTKMINKDISNYSAWHNRSKLVEKLFMNSPVISRKNEENKTLYEYLVIFNEKNKLGFLQRELHLFKTAIYTDPDDSSVWFYMKWLVSDYFLKDITNADACIEIINEFINAVKELNEVELEDNGVENKWCLISIVYLIKQLRTVQQTPSHDGEFNAILVKLQKLDPMRFERYKEFSVI